ncbi:MAG: hypothetical protein AB1898_13555 [Acidobacteriota bacterium]
MGKTITLGEEHYVRFLDLITALEEQSALFALTTLEYGVTLRVIASEMRALLEANVLVEELLDELDQAFPESTKAKAQQA